MDYYCGRKKEIILLLFLTFTIFYNTDRHFKLVQAGFISPAFRSFFAFGILIAITT